MVIFYLSDWIINLFIFLDGAQVYQKNDDDDTTINNYSRQTKILKINPGHPLIKGLFYRINHFEDDKTTCVCYPNFFE